MNIKIDKKVYDFSNQEYPEHNNDQLDFLLKSEIEEAKLPDDEWQQEYFIIYNSYILEQNI